MITGEFPYPDAWSIGHAAPGTLSGSPAFADVQPSQTKCRRCDGSGVHCFAGSEMSGYAILSCGECQQDIPLPTAILTSSLGSLIMVGALWAFSQFG